MGHLLLNGADKLITQKDTSQLFPLAILMAFLHQCHIRTNPTQGGSWLQLEKMRPSHSSSKQSVKVGEIPVLTISLPRSWQNDTNRSKASIWRRKTHQTNIRGKMVSCPWLWVKMRGKLHHANMSLQKTLSLQKITRHFPIEVRGL